MTTSIFGIGDAVPVEASSVISRISRFINYQILDLSEMKDRHCFWFLQDVMSISLLVALLAQSMTLVERYDPIPNLEDILSFGPYRSL